jgi:Arc/MetJ family transcription regulator
MRTTVNIDDHLLAEAKTLAVAGHKTIGNTVNDGIRLLLG